MSAIDILEAMEQKGMKPRGLPLLIRDLLIHYLGDLSDKRVLDIGCGTNRPGIWLSRELANAVGEMHGADLFYGFLKDGEMEVVDGVRVHRKDAACVDEIFPPGYFDGVVSTFFFDASGVENGQQQKRILEGLHKVTKPDGVGIHYVAAPWYLRLGTADLQGIGYRVLTRAHDTHFEYAARRLTVHDLVPYEDFARFKQGHEAFQRRLDGYRGDGFAMSTINDLFHTIILQKSG